MKTKDWKIHSIMADRLRLLMKKAGIKGSCRPHQGALLFDMKTDLFRVRISFLDVVPARLGRVRTRIIPKGSGNAATYITCQQEFEDACNPSFEPEAIIERIMQTLEVIQEFETNLANLHAGPQQSIFLSPNKIKNSPWYHHDKRSDVPFEPI